MDANCYIVFGLERIKCPRSFEGDISRGSIAKRGGLNPAVVRYSRFCEYLKVDQSSEMKRRKLPVEIQGTRIKPSALI